MGKKTGDAGRDRWGNRPSPNKIRSLIWDLFKRLLKLRDSSVVFALSAKSTHAITLHR